MADNLVLCIFVMKPHAAMTRHIIFISYFPTISESTEPIAGYGSLQDEVLQSPQDCFHHRTPCKISCPL